MSNIFSLSNIKQRVAKIAILLILLVIFLATDLFYPTGRSFFVDKVIPPFLNPIISLIANVLPQLASSGLEYFLPLIFVTFSIFLVPFYLIEAGIWSVIKNNRSDIASGSDTRKIIRSALENHLSHSGMNALVSLITTFFGFFIVFFSFSSYIILRYGFGKFTNAQLTQVLPGAFFVSAVVFFTVKYIIEMIYLALSQFSKSKPAGQNPLPNFYITSIPPYHIYIDDAFVVNSNNYQSELDEIVRVLEKGDAKMTLEKPFLSLSNPLVLIIGFILSMSPTSSDRITAKISSPETAYNILIVSSGFSYAISSINKE